MLLTLVAASLAFAAPSVAARGSWNNWHVHDGSPTVYTDATGLTHRGVSIFPAMFGISSTAYIASPALWAYCTDATDKSLLGPTPVNGNQPLNAGHCQNASSIIHIRANPGSQLPPGWTGLVSGGVTYFFKITAR